MLHVGIKMGIPINGTHWEFRAPIFRHSRLDRQPSSRLLGTHPGIQGGIETRRGQIDGCAVRLRSQHERRDFKPLLRRRLESQGRGSIRTHGKTSRTSGTDEIRQASVRKTTFSFPPSILSISPPSPNSIVFIPFSLSFPKPFRKASDHAHPHRTTKIRLLFSG